MAIAMNEQVRFDWREALKLGLLDILGQKASNLCSIILQIYFQLK